jgi:hypothetical protein
MELAQLRVTEAEREAGLARFHTNLTHSARSLLWLFGIGAVALVGFSFAVDRHASPWFLGAAVASAVCGGLIWLFARGPFARSVAQQAAELPWHEGVSFVSPGSGLVYAGRTALLLERGVWRTSPRFAHARYVRPEFDPPGIELGELLPDSDGNFATLSIWLPPGVSEDTGEALAVQLREWWC